LLEILLLVTTKPTPSLFLHTQNYVTPQNGHGKISDQAKCDEGGPEDLALHPYILA
jgi:hypothetical protein